MEENAIEIEGNASKLYGGMGVGQIYLMLAYCLNVDKHPLKIVAKD